jgi:hypothetical protein
MSFAFAPGQISLDNFLRKFGILYLYSGMIGIVRNPWEWQVSMYDFLLENTTNPERTFMRAYSGAWRPVIPIHIVHRNRSMPSTDSGLCRPLFGGDRI